MIYPNNSVRCFRTSWALLVVVLILTTSTVALGVETSSRHDNVNINTKRCADTVVMYLKRVVTRRSEILEREKAARMELEEVRGIRAEEESGQRKKEEDTEQRLKKAWAAFESASAAVKHFDESTLQMHGTLPRACIKEVNALRSQNIDRKTVWGKIHNTLEILALHLRLYWELVSGVCSFTFSQYEPYLKTHEEVVRYFSHHTQVVRDQLQLHQKNRAFDDESNAFFDMAQVTFMYAKIAMYTMLPWASVFAVFFFTTILFPFVLALIFFPNLIWRLLVQLFLLHHAFGLTPEGFITSLNEYVGLLVNQNWAELQNRLTEAFLTLATDGGSGTFFNGIVGIWFIIGIVAIMLLFMYRWMRLPYMLFGDISGAYDEVSAGTRVTKRAKKNASNDTHPGSSKNGGGSGSTRSSSKISDDNAVSSNNKKK